MSDAGKRFKPEFLDKAKKCAKCRMRDRVNMEDERKESLQKALMKRIHRIGEMNRSDADLVKTMGKHVALAQKGAYCGPCIREIENWVA